jgi:hypothetical protein
MSKLAGKIALITGGNKEFVGEGAYVFITARRATELDKAAKEIGKNVTGVPGDVSKLGDLDRLLPGSGRRRVGSTSYSPMPASQSMRHWATSPRISTRDIQHQREGSAFHGAESAAFAAGRCRDHPDFIHRRKQRIAGQQRICRHQSCPALLHAYLDDGLEAPPDSGERDQSGIHQHAGPDQPLAIVTSGRGATKNDRGSYPTGQARKARRGRQGTVFLASDDASYITGTELFVDGGFAQV